MNVKNLSIILLLSSLITGCSSIIPLEVNTVPVEKQRLDIAELEPIKLKNIEWFVITPDNYIQVFNELKKKNYDLVLFGLTDDGYEGLSMNMIKLREYLLQQSLIIKSYKNYYEPKIKE